MSLCESNTHLLALPDKNLLPGRTHAQIQNRAYRLGIVLLADVFRKNVHGAAAEHMRMNNPSKLPGASERLRETTKKMWSNRPDIVEKLFKGQQQLQKTKPTKLEQKLFQILEKLSIEYTPYAVIKPKFIVDAQVDKIIIQADGEWWHGHPRFSPLNDRQIAQQKRDTAQDAYLKSCGFTVIRIWEREMRLDLVRERLLHAGLSLCP
jgi:very-short-patch-repair endonuclease